MNIGAKITALKDGSGFKTFKELGDVLGLSADWLSEISRKETIQTVDVTRLIKIADYFNVSIDWLLSDDNECNIKAIDNIQDNDILNMLNQIDIRLNGQNNKFNSYPMNEHSIELAKESINIIKALIKQNL